MHTVLYTYGDEARVESHKILPMVIVLVIHGNEGSHEETLEGVSTVPGRDRNGSFQQTLVDHHNGITTGWKR